MPKKTTTTKATTFIKKPIAQNIPKELTGQNAPKKPIGAHYHCIGKECITQITRKSIPKQLMITSKFIAIFGIILLVVVIFSASQFPISKLLSGNPDITLNVGYPFHFLEMKIINQEESPFQLMNLLLDLLIYIALAYIIDIAITFIGNSNIVKAQKDERERPVIYKNIKPTIADKITKKVFEK